MRRRSSVVRKRIEVEFTDDQLDIIDRMCQEDDIPRSEAIRRLVAGATAMCKACGEEPAGYCATCMYLERMKGEEMGGGRK